MDAAVLNLEPFGYVGRQLPDRHCVLYTDESGIPFPAPPLEAESNRLVCMLLSHELLCHFIELLHDREDENCRKKAKSDEYAPYDP